MLTGLRSTTSSVLDTLRASLDEDFRGEIEQHRERCVERLRSSAETAVYGIRTSLEGLAFRWPADFNDIQFEAQYLPLIDAVHFGFRDAEGLVESWAQMGPSLERQASDLAARIAGEHPVFTPRAVAPLRRHAELTAEARCYPQGGPGLRASLARLREQLIRITPTIERNLQTYARYITERQQYKLTECAERAANAIATRDQLVTEIESTHRAMASRWRVKLAGSVVDRERWTIVPAKEEAHA